MKKPKKKYESRKQEPDRPKKKKPNKPKRQAIKDDLKRWDDVDWEKYGDDI